MNHALHSMLTAWLKSGTDAQKAHARHRLSLPDAIGYEVPEGWTPIEPDDAARAARLIAEDPPTSHAPIGRCCG